VFRSISVIPTFVGLSIGKATSIGDKMMLAAVEEYMEL
jgi:hypothetical protein